MSPAFDERTRQVIIETAKEIGVDVHPKGTAVSIEVRKQTHPGTELFI